MDRYEWKNAGISMRSPVPPIDMTGRIIGGWHVTGYAGSMHNRATWACRHECGAKTNIKGTDLRRGGGVSLKCTACGK